MKKYLILTIITVFTLLFVSCPEPLTEDVVVQSQDSIAPRVEIYSPDANATYFAQVDFLLNVKDDALEEGDEKGGVSSIAFEISNDDFRGGKINISPEGIVTQDSEGGPDTLNYNPESGDLSFSFSTIEPNILDGLLSVTVIVTDRNGNETQEKVALYENDGPWFNFTIVDKDNFRNIFLPNESVTFSGSVANSTDDLTSASDIYRIEWNISNILVGKLILDKEATYENPYDEGTFLNYYNSDTGLFESIIAGYLLEENANYFRYNPANGSFSASIFMKNQFESLGTLSFKFEVEDKSGHISTDTILLSLDVDLPDIGGTGRLDDDSYGHFSENGNSDPITLLCGDDFAALNLSYRLKSGEYETSSPISITGASGTEHSLTIDSGEILNLVADPTSTSTVSVIVTAVNIDDEDISTSMALTIREDSDAPVLTSYSFTSDHTNNNYANSNSTLGMILNISEAAEIVGLNELELDLEIGGYSPGTFNINEGLKDDISVSGSAWSSTLSTEGNVPVSITLRDRLENESIYTNSSAVVDDEIMHYPGTGLLSAVWAGIIELDMYSNSNGIADDEEDNWAAKSETVNLNIGSVGSARVLESVSNLSINAVAQGSPGFSNTYSQSTENVAGDDLEVSCLVIDMAGNQYSVSASGLVTYDSLPPSSSNLIPTLDDLELGTFYVSTVQTDSESLSLPVMDNTALMDINFDHLTYSNLDVSDNDVTVNTVDFGTLSTVDDDTYIARFVIYDKAGNSTPKDIEYTVERSAPTITVTRFESTNTGIDVSYASKTHNVLLDFSVTDGGSGLALATYDVEVLDNTGATLTLDSSTAVSNGESSDSRSYTKSLSSAVTGDNAPIAFSIIVADVAGNVAEYNNTSVIDGRQYTDTSVEFYSSALVSNMGVTFSAGVTDSMNSRYWAKGTEEITVTATSPVRDLHSSSVVFNSNSGDQTMTVKSGDDASRVFKYDMTTAEPDGALSFDLAFTDKAGNSLTVNAKSSDDDSYTVYYDDTAPVADSVTYTLNDSDTIGNGNSGVKDTYINSYADTGETADFSGLVETYYEGFIYSITGPDTITTPSGIQSGFNVDLTDLIGKTDGTYTVNMEFFDYAGNSDTATATVILDEGHPTVIDIIYYAEGSGEYAKYAKDNERVTLTFTALDPSGSGFDSSVADAISIKDKTANMVGSDYVNREYYIDIPVGESSHNDSVIPVDIIIMDRAGNKSTLYDESSASDTVIYYYGSPKSYVTLSYDDVQLYSTRYIAAYNDNYSLDYSTTRDLKEIVGKFSTETVEKTVSPSGASGTFDTDIINDSGERDKEYQITFSLSNVEDMAGNTCTMDYTDIAETLWYDDKAPDVSSIAIAPSGDGTSGVYINSNATSSGTFLTITNPTDVDPNFKSFRYKIDGLPASWSSDQTGPSVSVATASLDISTATAVDGDAHTIEVEVSDQLNQTSSGSAQITFYIDNVAPTITATGDGVSTLTIDFGQVHGLSAGDVSISQPFSITNLTSNTIEFTSLLGFFTGEITFNTTAVNDDAENDSRTSFNITYGTGALTVSGLSAPNMTIQPDITPSDGPTSYRSIRTYDYSSNSAMRALENGQKVVFDTTEISELKKERISSPVAVSYRSGAAAAGTNVSERIIKDLDTSNKVLKEVMDEIALSEAEYEARLQSLMTPKLTRARLERMETIFEPEIIPPEIITVSATPFLTGGAADIQIVAGTEIETMEKPMSALLIQILGALMLVLLTFGFIVVLKKMSKT